ncbi:single-stranded DNA-binding protein [Streptomyces sp. NPDC001970]
MNETMVTLVGNVATGVEYRESASGGYARFRFAVTSRRWDRQRELWADGPTSFYTVWAWRTLGLNLAASVSVGEPLVVHGRLRVREEERDGGRRTSIDIDAVSIGHDMARGTSAFRRAAKDEPYLTDRPGDGADGGAGGGGGSRTGPTGPPGAPGSPNSPVPSRASAGQGGSDDRVPVPTAGAATPSPF